MGDVIDAVGVERDGSSQVHLDLVGGGDGPHQVGAAPARVLRHGDECRDVVPGVGVLGGQEGVVVVEVAHGDAIGPRRPLG